MVFCSLCLFFGIARTICEFGSFLVSAFFGEDGGHGRGRKAVNVEEHVGMFGFWRDFVTVICLEQIFNSSAFFHPSSLFLGISWLESFFGWHFEVGYIVLEYG